MRLALIATPDDKSQRIQGFAAVTLSAVAFGLLGLFGKAAFARGLTPGEFLALRFLTSALMLVGFVSATRPRALLIERKHVLRAVALGFFGTSFFCMLYFEALKRLPASLCVLIFYTNPVLIAAGGWILFGQRPGNRTLASLPLVTVGVALLVLQDLGGGTPEGIALCLVSAVVYTGYVLTASRWLKEINPIIASCYILTTAALTLGVLHLNDLGRAAEAVRASWDLVLEISAVATVIPMILLFWGLTKLRPAEVGLLSTVEPVAGVILAVTILGESLTVFQVVGGVVIVGTLIFMAFEAPHRSARADAQEPKIAEA